MAKNKCVLQVEMYRKHIILQSVYVYDIFCDIYNSTNGKNKPTTALTRTQNAKAE